MKKWFLKMVIKYILDYIPKGANSMVGKIVLWLSGKKMYLAALALAIEGIVAYLGDNDLNKLIQTLIAAWGIAAAKAAIVKSAQ